MDNAFEVEEGKLPNVRTTPTSRAMQHILLYPRVQQYVAKEIGSAAIVLEVVLHCPVTWGTPVDYD